MIEIIIDSSANILLYICDKIYDRIAYVNINHFG